MSKLDPFRNLDTLFQTAEICLPLLKVHSSKMDPSGQARLFSSSTGREEKCFFLFSGIVTLDLGTMESCEKQLELCTLHFLTPPCAGPPSYLERGAIIDTSGERLIMKQY